MGAVAESGVNVQAELFGVSTISEILLECILRENMIFQILMK